MSTIHDEPLTDEALSSLLSTAVTASKKAGEIILGNAGGVEVMERKANSRDLLTVVDPLCEKVCCLIDKQQQVVHSYVIFSLHRTCHSHSFIL
jgi:hypothetical protein